jgi:hypothetical protein
MSVTQVQSGFLGDNSVTFTQIVDGSVTTDKIDDNAIIASKISTTKLTTSTGTSKTLVNRELCSITADSITIDLPASPSAGWEVGINNTSTFANITIARNGQLLMGLSENMTLDVPYVTISLVFVNNTVGWRIV